MEDRMFMLSIDTVKVIPGGYCYTNIARILTDVARELLNLTEDEIRFQVLKDNNNKIIGSFMFDTEEEIIRRIMRE